MLKTEFVRDRGTASPVAVPSFTRHGLPGPPPFSLPAVEEDGELIRVAIRTLEGPAQLPLVPRHDQ